ncbi:MAG: TolB family protein [Anaerolineales bacterium]
MSRIRWTTWLFLGAGILVACRPVSSPAVENTAPPGPGTIQISQTPTIKASPDPTADSAGTAPPSTTPTPELSPLPACNQASEVELDELTLAFAANWDGDREIYTIRADGSNQTQLTSNTSGDVLPVWSPDGEKLAFIVDRYTEPKLFISDEDGLMGKIVAPEIDASAPALNWSPAGDRISFRNLDDVYVIEIETGEALNITQGTNLLPLDLSISTDGSMLAFTADALDGTARNRLFVVNVDGTGLKEISFPEGDIYRPKWHPFQEKILFEGIVPGEGVVLHVATIDGAIEKLPIVPRYRAPKPVWSPDGSMIGYIVHLSGFDSSGERMQLNSLRVATAAGEVDLELLRPPDDPDVGLSLHEIVWAPDSRHLVYSIPSESADSGVDLIVLDICDGSSVLIAEAVDSFSTPSWRPLP